MSPPLPLTTSLMGVQPIAQIPLAGAEALPVGTASATAAALPHGLIAPGLLAGAFGAATFPALPGQPALLGLDLDGSSDSWSAPASKRHGVITLAKPWHSAAWTKTFSAPTAGR